MVAARRPILYISNKVNTPISFSDTNFLASGSSHVEMEIKMPVNLSIVVPCYNEEEVLPETNRRLAALLDSLIRKGKINAFSRVYYVDDGSRDQTWHLIETLSSKFPFVSGIKLSHNCGHQNALIAGMYNCEGDIIITIDADLQDDLNAVEAMLEAYSNGYDIVYGVRKRRGTDTFFKRITAEGYYKLMSIMGVEVVFNHADYRLMSKRSLRALRQYVEVNLFLRGIIPLIGFPSTTIYYDRLERFAGKSKYPISKMLAFAWQGITSFSPVPLRLITALGFGISFCSLSLSVWAVLVHVFTNATIPGWASTVVPIYLLGGIQLLCIGIIGEYLSKVYMETKRRPTYFVDKIVSGGKSQIIS